MSLYRSSPDGILPLGSDFPVEGINPLLGFYAAVSRLDVRGESPHGPGGWCVACTLSDHAPATIDHQLTDMTLTMIGILPSVSRVRRLSRA